jgi:hypothetical protein
MKALVMSSPGKMVCLVVSLLGLGLCAPGALAQQAGAIPSPGGPPVRMMLVDPGPIGVNTTTALFAQVAIGGGYTTVFTLMNTGTGDLGGVLVLTGANGNPLNAKFSEPPAAPITASSIDITPIHSGGTRFITAGPVNPGDATTTGWGRIESSGGTIGGVGTFEFTQAGKLTTIAGVLAGSTLNVATVPVDNDGAQNRFTGYAIANDSNANINVKIVVVNANGAPVQTLNLPQLNPLGPRQQTARFLHQDVPSLLTFQGSMVLIGQGGSRFSIVALVLDQGLITAVPVIPSKAPGIN